MHITSMENRIAISHCSITLMSQVLYSKQQWSWNTKVEIIAHRLRICYVLTFILLLLG